MTGRIMYADTASSGSSFATTEATITQLKGKVCKSPFYGYRILLDPQAGPQNDPALYIASQSCWDKEHEAHLFVRGLNRCQQWMQLPLEEIQNPPENWNNNGPNQASLRWIEPNPLQPGNVFVGTTDMNHHVGSLTGRIFEIERPFQAVCP